MLPDRMLEGENPKTPFAKDARHWISVYQRMIVFKGDLLGRLRTQVLSLPKAARRDVTENDIGLIQSQLERYERRLVFWYGLQWRLEGLHIDDNRVLTFQERTVGLTKRELQLLVTLVSRSPSYITAQQLLVQAWRDAKLPEETLRTYIMRLRKKLSDVGVGAVIRNQPRRGYALIFPPPAAAPEKKPARH